jgi:nucleotide-binding universal stress UspA family protein/predicted transcriptional regulator
MSKSVVVPLDGSPLAARALPYAAHVCRKTGAQLLLVRAVVPLGGAVVTDVSAARIAAARQTGELRTALSEVAGAADDVRGQGIAVGTRVQVRNPVDLIRDVARSEEAGLIVMSTHGRSGFGRYLYGSVADELLRQADVPLLLLPPACERPFATDRRLRLLVPLDGSALAEDALDPARALAEALGGDVLLLQVTPPADSSSPLVVRSDPEAGVAEAMNYLEAVAATMRSSAVAVAARAVAGDVGQTAPTIARLAREEGADLIVMATHGRGGLARLVLGSIATGVLQRTTVPIMLLRPTAMRRAYREAEREPAPDVVGPAPSLVIPSLQVRDIMASPAVVVPEQASLLEVAKLMVEHRIGAVAVVDNEGKLRGIVTESDFTGKERGIPFSVLQAPQVFGEFIDADGIEAIHARARSLTAWEIMSRPVETASETEPVTEVVTRMIARDLHRLPVVRAGVPIGMVTRHDVLRLMAGPEIPRAE